MIRINQIKLLPNHSKDDLENEIAKILHLKKNDVKDKYKIIKQSIDSRKKPEIFLVYSVQVDLPYSDKYRNNKDVQEDEIFSYSFDFSPKKAEVSPVIVGMGPAGLFAGLCLAKAGLKPVIIERGRCVSKRVKDVEEFFLTNKLDPCSNVQFGEGGAGTFSDGKLNTMVKDPYGRIKYVLETFVRHGADSKILYMNKPHIGTDVLRKVVVSMREEILSLGGRVLFESRLSDIVIKNNKVTAIIINDKETIACDRLVLAIGHSARDTFEMIRSKNINMTSKSFAVGVRVEHPQKLINVNAYGDKVIYNLPAADYKVTHQCANGRGVYSFCMCPGGYVVNASSEDKRLAINGMSYSGRNGDNANSALIVTVTPDDFSSDDVLAGVNFQRKLEERAYIAGNSYIPVQRYGDYKNNIISRGYGNIISNTKGNTSFGNVRDIFPDYINDSLLEGIEAFGRKISGYNSDDVLISGVESRTSSPIRILRDSETFESNVHGIYPCGEGAGYAGGITSACVDGIKVAEKIYKHF